MIFFGGGSSRVTAREFRRKLKSRLRNKGFSRGQIHDIESIFRGDMHESGSARGISKSEMEQGIRWMRTNRSKHTVSSEKIDILEEELKALL